MHQFHYRSDKSALFGLLLGGLALFYGWSFLAGDGDFFMLAIALLFGGAATKLVMDATSSTPALSFDASVLRIRRMWGQVAELRWDEVHWIKVQSTTLRYYGIIPVAKHEHLVVKCDGGIFGGRRITLAAKLMHLPPGGVHQLCAALSATHLAAVGGAGIAMKGAGPQGWGAGSRPSATALVEASGPTFDADAALARYLARKDSAPETSVSLAGQGVPAPAAPAASTRPVFGRKSNAA